MLREFLGCLVVRILGFHCHGLGSVPGQGAEIPSYKPHGMAIKIMPLIPTLGVVVRIQKYLRQIGLTQYLILSWMNSKLIYCC